MKKCPMCSEDIPVTNTVCSSCLSEIHQNEPARRETVLYSWGRGLMIFLAIFFFLRGMFALIDPQAYQKAGDSIGFTIDSQTTHYVNAAVLLLVGLMYAICWLGSFLEKKWNRSVCLITLIIFIGGQLFVQFSCADSAEKIARALALILLWTSIPVIQYITYSLGKPHKTGNGEQKTED